LTEVLCKEMTDFETDRTKRDKWSVNHRLRIDELLRDMKFRAQKNQLVAGFLNPQLETED